jgi:hypothetical protein
MTRIIMAAALALAVSLPAAPAHAAARDRDFVASYGSDSNPCTFGSPCKTFQHAHDVVADSGEVTAIDSAGFGPLTITKGVTITSPNGVEAGVAAPAGGNAITIFATQNDAVILRGLTLAGSNSASYGVFASTAGKIEIVDSVIRDFSQVGINIGLGANFQTLVHISNTKVMNNAVTGVLVEAGAQGAHAEVNLDHLTVIDNNKYGIAIGTNVDAAIVNSNISNNGIGVANGCNVQFAGTDITHQAGAYMQNLTLMGGTCSISQTDWSSVFASNVFGSQWQQGFHSASTTDGTNVIALPANSFTQVRN